MNNFQIIISIILTIVLLIIIKKIYFSDELEIPHIQQLPQQNISCISEQVKKVVGPLPSEPTLPESVGVLPSVEQEVTPSKEMSIKPDKKIVAIVDKIKDDLDNKYRVVDDNNSKIKNLLSIKYFENDQPIKNELGLS